MLINIISGIIILGAVGAIALRVLTQSGLAIADNRVTNFILKDTALRSEFTCSAKDTAAVFGLALLFRLAVFVISVFAIFIMRDRPFSFDELIRSYMQWDANNYFRIAEGGYAGYVEDSRYVTLAFFPLYPWCVRVVSIFLGNLTVSGIVTSVFLYSGGCAYLYKLMACDYNKSTAIRCIVFISVFPHSFFFGTMMNESALFFTAVATLYYIRRHDWKKAGVFGAFAAMSRLAGVLLVVPAAVEWLEHYNVILRIRKKEYKQVRSLFLTKASWIFVMLLGTFVYLLCNYATTGEWFKFMEYQSEIWHNTTVYWGECLSVILEQLTLSRGFSVFSLWLPELFAIVFIVSLTIYGLRKTRNMYTAFLAVYLIINMSMSWPLSIARYMTCAIPAFMILSDFAERHSWCEQLITAVMAITFGVFFTAYFMGRQIM